MDEQITIEPMNEMQCQFAFHIALNDGNKISKKSTNQQISK